MKTFLLAAFAALIITPASAQTHSYAYCNEFGHLAGVAHIYRAKSDSLIYYREAERRMAEIADIVPNYVWGEVLSHTFDHAASDTDVNQVWQLTREYCLTY